jgi:hypothetical protein
MSNTPDVDPIGHAAKFVAIFAALPVIFGAMALALPSTDGPLSPAHYAPPFVAAALLLLVAFGVHRRSIAAVWAGIGLFALALVGLMATVFLGEERKYALLFWAVMLIWPVLKLWAAKEAMVS